MATALLTISAAAPTAAAFSSTTRNGSHLLSTSFPKKPLSSEPVFRFLSCSKNPTSRPFSKKTLVTQISQYPTSQLESESKETLNRRLVLCALVSSVCCLACGAALAAADSIRASGFGLKVATALRSLGWPDEAVVFALATLPVLELRGAIPVGYWMHLHPMRLTVLSILGNMVPVPIIILYLKKLASFLSQKNASATNLLDHLVKRAREKAGPVEEFQWLGLMLFVAVPFPGTGAWTGAFIAAILDMPFWSAVSANFCGVVLAGLLVNLLVNLGIKYAVVVVNGSKEKKAAA
ncbi:uncharacterized protein A4U43_C07F35550 [Asparagus officinalis]|uniref:Small multi-drug export protein n=1 Tax=Asparagus officinalis TaxID=4686 RepID=A0A5P1EHM4_ASPOF|nr:uncharacterized protein A4U43_C07F35550 [Asparagus officinalis]